MSESGIVPRFFAVGSRFFIPERDVKINGTGRVYVVRIADASKFALDAVDDFTLEVFRLARCMGFHREI